MVATDLEQQIARLAVLDEPVRRALYFYVAEQQREVSREEAAAAMGITRTLAGFHLDRLAKEGLLDTSFRRLSGLSGPGAGRPAKLYRRSGGQIDVSLPERRYELAARILVEAAEARSSARGRAALRKTARKVGERVGADSHARVAASAPLSKSKKAVVGRAMTALSACGYEPVHVAGEIRLRNCPFHALVSNHTDLVCGMNLALMQGVVRGLELSAVKPVLDPRPGMCCVALRLPGE
jgi:predicted ArsR family transcriptional regulator